MAQKRKPHLNSVKQGDTSKKKRRDKKNKQKHTKTPMQRVMVMGPTGKTKMVWRPW